jgi:hypothetical protein
MSIIEKTLEEMVYDDIQEWITKKYSHFNKDLFEDYVIEYWEDYFSSNSEKMLDNFDPIRYDNNEDPIDY